MLFSINSIVVTIITSMQWISIYFTTSSLKKKIITQNKNSKNSENILSELPCKQTPT